MQIRAAMIEDAGKLTQIAFASKRTWPYPEHFLQIWKDELTITPEYIRKNTVFVAEETKLIGFTSLVFVEKESYYGNIKVEQGYWMDHLFIHPEWQHKGIGTQLWDHMLDHCKNNSIHSLMIFADPNAKGFYEKIGAEFVYDSPSSIPGRKLPVYKITL